MKHWCASFRLGHDLCWEIVPNLGDVCARCREELGCYFCPRGVPHVHIERASRKAA